MIALEERLKPLRDSNSGFLGKNETLAEIQCRDNTTLSMLGLSHQQVAHTLQYFLDFSDQREYKVGAFKVEKKGWLGYQGCPWGDETETDLDIEIKNEETGRKIFFSGLLPHLIGSHQFFEGKGAIYRLNPLEVVVVLGIKSSLMTSEEIEARLFQELKDGLEKPTYKSEFEHALRTIGWFRDKEKEYLSRTIIGLIPAFYEATKEDPCTDRKPITIWPFRAYLDLVKIVNDQEATNKVRKFMAELQRTYLQTDDAYIPSCEYMLSIYKKYYIKDFEADTAENLQPRKQGE